MNLCLRIFFFHFTAGLRDRKIDLKIRKSILAQSTLIGLTRVLESGAIGFHFSNTIFFVYHSELSWLPYCTLQLNSIKLPLP